MNGPFKAPGMVDGAERTLNEAYLERAIWMLFFRNRHSPNDYTDITLLVGNSKWQAGPPALRLARAMWSLEDRLAFAGDVHLQAIEEENYSRLLGHHRDAVKARKYKVWAGIEPYCALREKLVGAPPLVPLEVPSLDKLDWRLVDTLRAIDTWDHYHRGHKPDGDLTQIATLGLKTHPLHEQEVGALHLLGKALDRLQHWYLVPKDKQREYDYRMANKAFWHHWKRYPPLQRGEFAKLEELVNRIYYDFPSAR